MLERLDHPALAAAAARYQGVEGVPLRVVAEMEAGVQVASYDPPNLDNLLAAAVVMEATAGRGLPPCGGGQWYWLPVPLRLLWRSAEGLPLYASGVFEAEGAGGADVYTWHKRAPWFGWSARAPNPRNGRWMERRVPRPARAAERWVATAVGDPEEVARLLRGVSHLGKDRARGLGLVRRWRVEPLAGWGLVAEGRLVRPLPAEAVRLLGGALPAAGTALVGWTMPQWRPALFRPGWWSGTPCE